MLHKHMVVGLHQLEHSRNACVAIDHESGAELVGCRRHEAGHQACDGCGIGVGGAAEAGCSHGRTRATLRQFPRSVHMSPDDHAYAPPRVGRSAEEGIKTMPSVCPHDCTSTCALEVERLSPTRIGRVRGSQRNDYTAGVICEKVARYAERIHHPERLMKPLRRVGPKGSKQFAEISWKDALDMSNPEAV